MGQIVWYPAYYAQNRVIPAMGQSASRAVESATETKEHSLFPNDLERYTQKWCCSYMYEHWLSDFSIAS